MSRKKQNNTEEQQENFMSRGSVQTQWRYITGASSQRQSERRGTALPPAVLTWMSSCFDKEVRYGFQIWNTGKSAGSTLSTLCHVSLLTTYWLFFSSFLSFPPFLPLFPLPSFFPSAWQEQLSVHGEQGCSRRHLWKSALATDLSSSAIPGQSRLQDTLAVRRHAREEGGQMRKEEMERKWKRNVQV